MKCPICETRFKTLHKCVTCGERGCGYCLFKSRAGRVHGGECHDKALAELRAKEGNQPIIGTGHYDRRCSLCWSVTECRTVERPGQGEPIWACDECVEGLITKAKKVTS